MSYAPEPTPGSDDDGPLGARFRASELDRSISSLRFRLGYMRWLILPVVITAMIAMVVGLFLGAGSPGPMIGGILALAGATAALSRSAEAIGDDIADLREERESLGALLRERSGDRGIPPGEP